MTTTWDIFHSPLSFNDRIAIAHEFRRGEYSEQSPKEAEAARRCATELFTDKRERRAFTPARVRWSCARRARSNRARAASLVH